MCVQLLCKEALLANQEDVNILPEGGTLCCHVTTSKLKPCWQTRRMLIFFLKVGHNFKTEALLTNQENVHSLPEHVPE